MVRFVTDITDPSDMDVLVGPMTELLQKAMNENPDAEILLNLSSGTPQMEIILAQFALDPRYSTRGIQVKTPERRSGLEDRTNKPNYSVDDALEMNLDEEADAANRCCEPRMMAVRREAARNQLRGLLEQRNYGAIAQMTTSLPGHMVKLARHLDYRSRFMLDDAEKAAEGLSISGLAVGKGELPYSVYQMVEFMAMLNHLVYQKRYTDFLLRLNPFLVEVELAMLREKLKENGISERDLIPKVGSHLKISPADIQAVCPNLLAYMDMKYGSPTRYGDLSVTALYYMLQYFGLDADTDKFLGICNELNKDLRNPSAHSLFSVTPEQIADKAGMDAQTMAHKLERMMLDALSNHNEKALKNRLAVYDRCDQILRDCL